MSISTEQIRSRVYLMEELRVSTSIIKSGLAILQQSAPTYPRHFLILLTLSTGFERMMKILLNLHSLTVHRCFLTGGELKNDFGHNLVKLRDAITARCFTDQTRRIAVVQEDYAFLLQDPVFTQLLKLLSDFANKERYIYMNGINDPGQRQRWLSDGWTDIENSIIKRDIGVGTIQTVSASDLTSSDKAIEHATREIVICVEKYLRAMARIVTLSNLRSEAKGLAGDLLEFILLDKSLGTREYTI